MAALDTAPAELTDRLQAALGDADPVELESDSERIAYWLNAYNLTLLRELESRPRSGRLFRHRRLFRTAVHRADGLDYSLDVIEHGLLRGNRRPPLGFRRLLAASDRRLAAAPARPDPRIHFALNCGARSCPPVKVYVSPVEQDLERAARSYLLAESDMDPEGRRLTLPGLMRLYRRDFGGRGGMIAFAAARLPDAEWLRRPGSRVRLRFNRFDWRMAQV